MVAILPVLAFAILIVPVVAGLAGMALPAFGYLPVLGGNSFSLAPLADLLARPGIGRSALLSLTTGFSATFIAFAIVMLFVASWHGTRIFRALERLVAPLLSVPHAATAFGFLLLVAPSGFLARLVSPWLTGWDRPPDLLVIHDPAGMAMIIGLAVKEIPFLLLMTLAALPQTMARERTEMTASLGYGRIAGFLHATMPALYGQLHLPVLAVLAYSTSVVDVALILGPTLPAPVAVRVLAWQNDPDLGMRFVAASAALTQLGVTAAALLIWMAGERVAAGLWRLRPPSGKRFRRDRTARIFGAFLMSIAAGTVIAGIALLALWSFAGPWRFPSALPSGLGLATWTRLGGGLAGTILDTILLATLSAAIALILAAGMLEFEARRGTGRLGGLWLLYLPLIVPQISFLFGLQVLLSLSRLDGTLPALVAVHLVFVYPYVLLSLSEPWRHWDPRYGVALRALGHGHNSVLWRARLPMLTRPLATAFAVGFAVSVGLYLPTLFAGAGRYATLTTETVALAAGGDPRIIGATALCQALLPFLAFAVAMALPRLLFRNRRGMRVSA